MEVEGELTVNPADPSIDVHNNFIGNVADPQLPQDAATKAYVDNVLLSFGISIGPVGIQGLLNSGISPSTIINNGAPITDFIGLNHAGGIIFYMDPSGNGTGLVAAATDQSAGTDWGCFVTDLPSVTNVTNSPPSGPGAEIGDGSTNASAILSVGNCPAALAALACDIHMGGGHNDWFLPSINELDEMYMKIDPGASGANNNIGNFTASFYWSSSEFDGLEAWRVDFNVGSKSILFKHINGRVRAIRAF